MIKIGDLKKHDEFIFNGEKYKILGISSYRSYNNVICLNVETKKRKWLDIATEVMPYCENLKIERMKDIFN